MPVLPISDSPSPSPPFLVSPLQFPTSLLSLLCYGFRVPENSLILEICDGMVDVVCAGLRAIDARNGHTRRLLLYLLWRERSPCGHPGHGRRDGVCLAGVDAFFDIRGRRHDVVPAKGAEPLRRADAHR